MLRVGVISDTHGLLRDEAIAFLRSCDRIIHAGDITDQVVLDTLSSIAPVTVVRGNNDRGAWTAHIPHSALIDLEQIHVYVVHDLADIEIDPVAVDVRVVISGHSHKPSIDERNGVLYLNPGSAGPRRFTLPIAMAELIVSGKDVRARIIDVDPQRN